MGLFRRKKEMVQYGLFKGYTDFHSHILPGVDDGVKTLEDSLAILAEYESAGVSRVWLTPHVMEDIPNVTADLESVFGTLCGAYHGNVELKLAAENMLDSLFEERLSKGDVLTMDSNRLLVETSYYNPPMDLHGLVKEIKSSGYFPVLAHPERYIYMDFKEYEYLKSENVAFQLNIPSLCGFYGESARKKAVSLLERGMYDCTGSDLHRGVVFGKMLESRISDRHAKLLADITYKFL